MKHITTILTLIFFSGMVHGQTNDYKTLWQKVEKLEQENLSKSALEVVSEISNKAKKEDNTNQFIKALLHKSKYNLILEEDAQLSIVTDFKTEIEKATSPTKNILHNYLAGMYWQYFQNNRYQFYNRSTTAEKVDSSDFRTWDLNTLFHEVDCHFEASLEDKTILQKSNISDFSTLLNQQKNSEKYRPTLFDVLAHEALSFYTTNENSITRPADKFEINDPKLLNKGAEFIKLKIETADNTSLQAKALLVYQDVLKFHINTSTDAYTWADIERLNFIKENAVFNDVDALFVETLTHSASILKDNENRGLYQYEVAQQYKNWGNTYDPKTNTNHRFKLREALEICNSVLSDYPKSYASEKCQKLKTEILVKKLNITTEGMIPVQQTGRLLVSYTNVSEVVFSALKITNAHQEKLARIWKKDEISKFLSKLPVEKTWTVALKNENDYQQHSTEVILPPLPNHQYIIAAKTADDFITGYSNLQVTNFAIVETSTQKETHYQVINRNNGLPIPKAKIRFTYQLGYNNGPKKTQEFTTNNTGVFSVPHLKNYYNNVSIHINHNKETAYFNDYYIRDKNTHNPKDRYKAFLFTDRSIYRPGQPLYFKGIALKQSKANSEILTKQSVTVTLKDANYQDVSKLNLTTNEFGSFTGEFILPSNGLTGSFTLEVASNQNNLSGYTSILVEEYKRPKFETTLEPLKTAVKINDSVTIKGNAMAYAGSVISDAKVVYRVKRLVRFPRWYYWYNPYFNSDPQEITHGETTTDANGKYEIPFVAIPDNSVKAKDKPVFNYEVTADVTDINGETHSNSTVVKVGYHSTVADIVLPETIDKNTDGTLNISTNNLNGEAVATNGTLKMYKLIAPYNVLRKRPWKAPDYNGFTKEEFAKLYPHDAFNNEDDFKQWQKGELVWQTTFNTEKSKEIALKNLTKFTSGKYKIELAAKDPFGENLEAFAFTNITAKNDKKIADNQLFEITTDKERYDIGDKARITLYSAADVTATVFVEKNTEIVATYLMKLNNNSKSFSVPVTADDLGGFNIGYSLAAYNDFNASSLHISVPYPSTDLTIETNTFRDKLKPGVDETWSFTIKGPKGEQVAAELLANMYDASLDSFSRHWWDFHPFNRPNNYGTILGNSRRSFTIEPFRIHTDRQHYNFTTQNFDRLNWFGFSMGQGMLQIRGMTSRMMSAPRAAGLAIEEIGVARETEDMALEETVIMNDSAFDVDSQMLSKSENKDDKKVSDTTENKQKPSETVQIRENLQETAFFFPQLHTDKDGNVSFNFTTPEALTKWNVQLLAHTKNLHNTVISLEAVTQKELMVTPNAPRFLREGDEIVISTKIANLSEQQLQGTAHLELTNAVTGKDITTNLSATGNALKSSFTVDSKGNTQVSWRLNIPEEIEAVQYKVIAKAGDFSDGEQNLLPVLSNRMLVTETLSMWVGSNESRTFTLDKLKNTTSTTRKNHKLTLEITSNPAWYAVQALPYLMEYPYECNEQTFSKYYANTLASFITNSNPRIKEVFNQWNATDALLSNLEKNQELKSLLIQETPWLRDAQSETEQKKRIALLFNLDKMKAEQVKALQKLSQNQLSSGAWPWFKGGRDNRYITQHIITGMGHLNALMSTNEETSDMAEKAIRYLDAQFVEEYENMKKYATNLNDDHLSAMQIQFLYMRSFFPDVKMNNKTAKVVDYYLGQSQKYWTKQNLYTQGMLALITHRNNDAKTASKIIKALKENSITSSELGMYWKANTAGYYWYQSPIETQALLIEAFAEIENDTKTIDNLKVWLLKNKQTNQWKTTKATTEAIYALLLQGSDWLSVTDAVDVTLGGEKINPAALDGVKVEAGTGYFKTAWNKQEVTPKMAEVTLSKKGNGIAWGGLYWQYFEDLDKITTAKTPLQLKKKLFLKKNTSTGEVISEIKPDTQLKVGDLVRVRVELRADRDMEFIHMKDMRAAGFEPIDVLSTYKWQDGLGYYQSTKDASTNFFFDFLPKGIYVFEYDLRVNNAGDFSNGITTIQSMYAPEFSSHSEGVRVKVGA